MTDRMPGKSAKGKPMRDFSRSLPMALLRAREVVMDRFRPSLRAFGITEQQWRVLRALYDHGEMETGHLADVCCLLTPSLSRILKHLETSGYISRRTSAEDQRRSLVQIAGKGEALIVKRAPLSEQQYREIEAALGPEKIAALYDTLDELTAALDQNEKT